jgi:hypothetical protein
MPAALVADACSSIEPFNEVIRLRQRHLLPLSPLPSRRAGRWLLLLITVAVDQTAAIALGIEPEQLG